MFQINEQTHEEKVKMYMKLSKKELIDMLIACNIVLEFHSKNSLQNPILHGCQHEWIIDYNSTVQNTKCRKCGVFNTPDTLTHPGTNSFVTIDKGFC